MIEQSNFENVHTSKHKGMNTMRCSSVSHFVGITLCLYLPTASFAADTSPTKKPANPPKTADIKMTPELKKDMAEMYQKMADCLRTDKSLEQCSRDAMTNCPVVEKTGHCPINEGIMAGQMEHPAAGMDMGKMKMKHSVDGGK